MENHLELVVVFDCSLRCHSSRSASRYAIVRHRVIPISLIIRRGVRYLLVSHGSILLALLFVGLIVTALLALLFKYLRPSALDHRPGFGCRRHRRMAVGALVSPALSRAGD